MPAVAGGGIGGEGRCGAGGEIRPGVLTAWLPPGLVDEVVAAAGRASRRQRKLPARAVVYFVIALCLFSGADSLAPPGYRAVMSSLLEGVGAARRGSGLPVSAAFTRARQRLGAAPLRFLFEAIRGPLAGSGTFALGLRLVAWDAALIELRALPALAAEFGPATGCGAPQIRLMTLIECGTRAMLDATFGGARDTPELALARRLTSALRPGMLLLADRLFPSYPLWDRAAATGAQLLWRAKLRTIYHPFRQLPDGTHLAIMPTPQAGRAAARARHKGRPATTSPPGHLIRVIDYHLTITSPQGTRRTEPIRLITTLTDHHRYPAHDLAALYARRWSAETSYHDLKSRLTGARFTLRSATPALARQELWALLATRQALAKISYAAATTAALHPTRISFTVTLRAVRDTIPAHPARTPATLRRACHATIARITSQPLPPPRHRTQPRALKTRTTKYARLRRDTPRPTGTITHHLHLHPTNPPPPRAP
jgi:hypothetical protein